MKNKCKLRVRPAVRAMQDATGVDRVTAQKLLRMAAERKRSGGEK